MKVLEQISFHKKLQTYGQMQKLQQKLKRASIF